jgi:type IV pilus assembly protein PilC
MNPEPAKPNIFEALLRKIFTPVSLQEKVNFARHLSVGIKSSMPVLESLRLIRRQTKSKPFGEILDDIIKSVNNGQSLAQSMERFEYVFGGFFISMVRVGESSGNLSQSLLYLSQELKKQKEIASRVKSAMIYPAVIFFATLGITAFLTFVIFPKILPVFSTLRVELPLTTRLLIKTLGILQNYGFYVGGGIVAVIIVIRVLLSFQKIHFLFDHAMLSIPVVSKVAVNVTLTNFTRSLSVLLKSGMTIVDALGIAKNTFHNMFYRREIERMIEGVKKGESMTRHLETRPRYFPAMLTGMIQVGEQTGNLEENLLYLAEFYESEVNESVGNLTTVIEPLLLLFMGFLVGFVALSIITPIYKVTQGLQI